MGLNLGDRVFQLIVTSLAGAVLALLALLVIILLIDAEPALRRYGVGFLITAVWDPVFERFGAAHLIYGTLVTTLIALVLAGPIAVGAALFLAEYAPPWVREPVAYLIELLAVIPSIIYGLWGFFVMAPFLGNVVEPLLKEIIGPVPFLGALFSGMALGKDLLAGGAILGIMILPTVMALSREVIRAVPDTQREGMIALGATKWETINGAVLPYARAGILGALMLGFARAFGETMAVTMVIGNSSTKISPSLLTPGYTMSSAIANQFTEADKPIYFSVIIEIALLLLLVSVLINAIARLLMWRTGRGPAGLRF